MPPSVGRYWGRSMGVRGQWSVVSGQKTRVSGQKTRVSGQEPEQSANLPLMPRELRSLLPQGAIAPPGIQILEGLLPSHGRDRPGWDA